MPAATLSARFIAILLTKIALKMCLMTKHQQYDFCSFKIKIYNISVHFPLEINHCAK